MLVFNFFDLMISFLFDAYLIFDASPEKTVGGKVFCKKDLFPLPLSKDERRVSDRETLGGRAVTVTALNYMHLGNIAVLDYLPSRIRSFLSRSFVVDKFDWGKFLQTRTLN